MICADAGAEIKLQCSGEYGLETWMKRIQELHNSISLPRQNLKICQLTTKMSQKMWQNFITLQLQLDLEIKKITATGICNHIVLFQSSQSVADSITKNINKVLNDSEKNCNVDQKT